MRLSYLKTFLLTCIYTFNTSIVLFFSKSANEQVKIHSSIVDFSLAVTYEVGICFVKCMDGILKEEKDSQLGT